MFPQKFQPVLTAFFMALFMSFLMSAVISFFNIGLPENFIAIWMKAWFMAFIVAFPIVMFVAPTVRKVVSLLIKVES